MSVWWFQGQQDMLLTDNCCGENELGIIMNSWESSDNLRWVGPGEKHSLGNWHIGVLSLWWVWVLFCHLDMQGRGFLRIPEQIKKHCSWIVHVSSILDLLLLYISITLVIQVMLIAIHHQNIMYRKWNKLHPKKQHHHSCIMLDRHPHVSIQACFYICKLEIIVLYLISHELVSRMPIECGAWSGTS